MARTGTGLTEGLLGGWQLNTNLFILSGTPFDVHYRNAGEDRDTGTGGLNDRPDLIGDPDGPQTRDQWFNATPIGSPGSAFGRPAKGTFGNLGRNALRGPGFWQMDMSVFKNFWLGSRPPAGGPHRISQRVQPRQSRQPRFHDWRPWER